MRDYYWGVGLAQEPKKKCLTSSYVSFLWFYKRERSGHIYIDLEGECRQLYGPPSFVECSWKQRDGSVKEINVKSKIRKDAGTSVEFWKCLERVLVGNYKKGDYWGEYDSDMRGSHASIIRVTQACKVKTVGRPKSVEIRGPVATVCR
jgi:hypothetical protein